MHLGKSYTSTFALNVLVHLYHISMTNEKVCCLKSDEIFTCESCGYKSGSSYGIAIHFKREHPNLKRKIIKRKIKIGGPKKSKNLHKWPLGR